MSPKDRATYSGPGTGEKVVENGDLVTEEHESVNEMRAHETGTTGNCELAQHSISVMHEGGRTEDTLALGIGQELDGGEFGDGGVLDRVGRLVKSGLGAVVLGGGAGNVGGLGAVLDVGGGLGVSRCWVWLGMFRAE